MLAHCKTPEIIKRAWVLRGKPAGSGPFIQDWLVCGPYTKPGATGAKALFDVAFGPEKPGAKVQWKSMPRSDQVNLAAFFPAHDNCVAYLRAQIIAPQDCAGALLMGSESHGLPASLLALTDERWRIPGGGGAESLSLPQAAAIMMYECTRKT